ncbi:hypothetical protein GCM10010082_05870 [Kushneria pakistanensis]|uniref:HTH arsR-type domain-containing protein n=2 Tax=Kushneria pakistanensis TaxID=1508770 RepID=A0ABQ3FBZ3_9GAMM|nr:hypothetical protein GCM10010082_05870 [Kushneria pakistanensis]
MSWQAAQCQTSLADISVISHKLEDALNAITTRPETNSATCDEVTLLKAMAHPDRLQVLRILAAEGEMQVTELNTRTELRQSAFSQHLKVLRDAGLVDVRRESQRIYYTLRRSQGSELFDTMSALFG